MKRYAPILIVLCAVTTAAVTFFGDNGLARLRALRQGVVLQKQKNEQLRSDISRYRREITGLQKDDRILEKVARSELGLARHGELIFIFDNYIDTNE